MTANNFANLTGAKIGDGKPGPVESTTATTAAADETAKTDGPTAEQVQANLDSVDRANEIAAPVRTSLDTATDPPEVGVVSAVDQQIDADTTIVHGEKADEQMNNLEVAADSVSEGEATIYSSHPIRNLSLGKYDFVNGQLKLTPDQVEDFENLVAQQPLQIQHSIKKIDVDSANRIASASMAGRQTTGVDTTANSLEAPNARPFAQ